LDAELYSCGEQHLQRRLQRMRHGRREPRQEGHSLATTHLPRAAHFTFDQPIHGRGWYRREQHRKAWICWMGVEPTAWIDLQPPSDGDCDFQCEVAHVVRASVLDGLRIQVNGEPLCVRRRATRSGVLLRARVPARALQADPGRARIAFSVDETVCPNDLAPDCGDERKLGVALRSIQLRPARAWTFNVAFRSAKGRFFRRAKDDAKSHTAAQTGPASAASAARGTAACR
jgi:hypothetical protein